MQKVFETSDLMEAHLLKGLLENEGIAVELQNEILSRLAGELPVGDVLPSLWIVQPDDLKRAQEFIVEYQNGKNRRSA